MNKKQVDIVRRCWSSSSIFSNAGWLMLEKGLLLGSGFLFTVVLTHYWSVAEFGSYQYLLALVSLLGPFSRLGLNSLVSREIVVRAESTDVILGTALLLRLFGSLLGGGVFFLMSFWLVEPSLQPLFWILMFAQLSHAFGVFDYYFEAKVQSKVSAFLRTTIGLSFMSIKLGYVVNGSDFSTILLLTAIEWGALAFMWLVVFQLYNKQLKAISWCSVQAKVYISRCGWLMLSSIAAIIYLKIDQVMLGWLDSAESVAFYGIASRLSEVWYLIPGIIVSSFYPSLIRKKELGEGYQKELQKLCDALCWVAILIAILMSFFAPIFVPLIFSDNYMPVVSILQVHIWAGIFIFMRALFSKWLLIEDAPKYSLITHGSGALINLLLNSLLIPPYGALGAAWATLISYAVASYIALFIFSKTRKMAVLMTSSLLLPMSMFKNHFIR